MLVNCIPEKGLEKEYATSRHCMQKISLLRKSYEFSEHETQFLEFNHEFNSLGSMTFMKKLEKSNLKKSWKPAPLDRGNEFHRNCVPQKFVCVDMAIKMVNDGTSCGVKAYSKCQKRFYHKLKHYEKTITK